jgi:hypothetical protein
MGSRALWLVPGAWCLMGAVSLACGSEDPGAYTIENGHGSSATGPTGSVESTGPTGGSSGSGGSKNHTDAGSGGKDGGAGKDKDAKGDTGPDVATVVDAGPSVFGGTAYKGVAVTTSAATLHQMMGGPKDPGPQMSCIGTCHNGAMKGVAEFLFAGSVYSEAEGGTGVETAEVRVIDDKGVGTSVYSDINGNFWAPGTAALATPGRAGVRDGVNEDTMPSALSSGDCNSCHNGGAMAQPIMHLP